LYEDCVEKFNCNRYPGHCSPACYRPIGQHNEPGVNSYKCCTCFPEVVEVFPMDRIWEGPAGRDGKDGASLEFAWEGTRLKVRVKGTEEWVYSTSLLGMQGPKGDTGEKGETGAIGPRGYTGAPGQDGDPGADGNGVDYVELHSSSGIVKTYRMYFTDGTYFDFTVTDGINGINGQDGEGVVEGGTTGQVLKKKSNDDFDTEWVDYAYDDLSGRPKINNITLSGNKSLSDLGIKQTYNKSDVGLGNVDNVRQYSVNNPPPYPVTSVNGNTGAVVIDTHDDLIPTQASSTNKLTTENFVNSTVATSTATFRGTYNSLAELEQVTADENDYGFVVDVDSAGNTVYNRYKYASGTWTFEYALNNSSFTAAQWEAIQSGITDNLVTKLQGIEAGAEVNIVEGLKIGNVTQQVSSKIMQINPDTTPMQGSNNVIDSNAVYEVEKLLPIDRESGENVDIDNAQPYKVLDIVADGKYQQNTTSGKQLFDKTQITDARTNRRVSTGTGDTYSATGYSVTPLIEIQSNTNYVITTGILSFFCWYDANQTYISGDSWQSGSSKTSPNNAKYLRFDFETSSINTVQLEQGSEATSYEPYTGGIPSPNPNYPQTITQVTSATWNRTGNNLFDKNNAIDGQRLGSDGTPYGDNNYCLSDFINVYPSTSYTYSRSATGGSLACYCLYDNEKNFISRGWWGNNTTDLSLTLTTSNNARYIRITDLKALKDNMQIEQGSGTTYSPYQGQTIPIDLDGNEVCAVSNTIKDKLLIDRYGNVALQKNVGKLVLNGSESLNINNNVSTNDYKVFYFYIADMSWNSVVLSDNFIYQNKRGIDNCIYTPYHTEVDISIDSTIATDTTNFKTWLSTHNATVYYALATPTIIPLPKLSVLPTTLKGINHIWLDTNLGRTQIEVEYVEDLSLAIPTKTSELTNDSGYVKNTDYASDSTGGVIRTSQNYGTSAANGILIGQEKTYANYQTANTNMVIAKGTLENVLTERIGTIETALTTLDVGGGVQ